jgi:hypothetical protein
MVTERLYLNRAVYYPHNVIQNEAMMKHALLLWDSVDTIVPVDLPKSVGFDRSPLMKRAAELIECQHVPSLGEQQSVYKNLAALLANGAQPWMRAEAPPNFPYQARYPLYATKFSAETWDILRRNGLIKNEAVDGIGTSPAVGLLLMALAAKAAAGRTRHTVTDRRAAYSWLTKLGIVEPPVPIESLAQTESGHNEMSLLCSVAIRAVSSDGISMKKLVEMREREAAGKDPDSAEIRHRYVKFLRRYRDLLLEPSLSTADRRDVLDDFEKKTVAHKKQLAAALMLSERELVLDDRLITGLWVAASLAAAAVASGGLMVPTAVVGVASAASALTLGKTLVKSRSTRKRLFAENEVSWLYQASQH